MSLQHAAQHLAAQGRGPDTTLMHVTPGEVKSLNELAMAHGGQLTINPQTGLPEAGFLSSILPMVAGIGLNMAFPGLGAMGAGLLTGGITGIATGSLSKGLMAGLGAYGGAGLGGALAQSGMQAAASASPELLAAQQSAVSNATALSNAAPNMVPYSPAGFAEAAQATTAPVAAAREAALAGQQATFNAGTFGNKVGTMFEGAKTGLGNIASNTPGGGMGLAKYGLAAASPLISEMGNKEQPKPVEDKDMGQRYTYSPNKVEGPYTASPTGVEQRYFNPAYTPISADKAKGIYGFADGGLSEGDFNLGGYSDGGRLLRGPGDGVSDSIPATIGHKQPARLADGEFVVPARIVSELGNGSTEAGARKLYAMMDRVQSARSKTVGKGKIAKNSRAEKHLPA